MDSGYYFDLFMGVDDVLDRVRMYWDIGGALPIPKWNVRCPVCGASRERAHIQIRGYSFHPAPDPASETPHRCDVKFKCRRCSMAWVHGVVVDAEMQGRCRDQAEAVGVGWRRTLRWREAAQILGLTEVA